MPPSGQPKSQASQDALAKVKADAAPKPKVETKPEDDDPEIETPWGEKLRKSEIARLREVEKNRKKFDAAAHKRFEEANKTAAEVKAERERLQAAFEQLKQNPWALHEQAGLNPDELAEQRLARAIEQERLTPEQIELREAKAELARVKAQNEANEAKTKADRTAQLSERFFQQFDTEVAQALVDLKLAHPKAPGSPVERAELEAAAATVEEMIRFREAGHEIDAKMAAQFAKDKLYSRTRKFIREVTDPVEFEELIGPEGMALAQKAWLARADQAPKAPPKPRAPQQPKPKTPPTFDQVRAQLGIRS